MNMVVVDVRFFGHRVRLDEYMDCFLDTLLCSSL